MSEFQNTRAIGSRFLQTPEGRIFVTGCCMLILWIEAVAVLWKCGYPIWDDLLTMGLAHMVGGRAASIARGTQVALPPALIALHAIYTDITAMFIMFPVLVFSYKNFVERRVFQEHMKPVFDAAQRGALKMRRFKIMGIFMFVWFPFWMTGIIVGAVLGFLIGLRPWVNMLTVSCGSATAVVCWVYAYDKLFGWLGGINQTVPVVFSSIIIAALVALRVIKKRREVLDSRS
jgi:uncharacterized membrane protein